MTPLKNKKRVLIIDSIKAYSGFQEDFGKLENPITDYPYLKEFMLKNLKFKFILKEGRINYVQIWGSIPKFYRGNNFDGFTIKEFRKAIKKIKKLSGIDISNFRVTRLDISICISLSHPIPYYLKALDYLPSFTRKRKGPGSYNFLTKTGKKGIKLYDKLSEDGKGSLKTEHTSENKKHILRIEYMNNGSIKDDYKRLISVHDLAKPEIYMKFPELLWKYVAKIQFRKSIDFEKIESYKDIIGILLVKGINRIGGRDGLNESLESGKLKGSITQTDKTKINQFINSALNSSATIVNHKIQDIVQQKVLKNLAKIYGVGIKRILKLKEQLGN